MFFIESARVSKEYFEEILLDMWGKMKKSSEAQHVFTIPVYSDVFAW